MKKLLAIAAVLCCTLGLFADAKPAFTQVTFGLLTGWPFGLTVGADIDWKVWEKPVSHAHDGSGKMYAGLDLAAQWGLRFDDPRAQMITIPLQGNFMYEFDTTQMPGAGPLIAVGPWFSTGLVLAPHFHYDHKGPEDKKSVQFDFSAGWAWGLGVSLAFNNNWGLKAGFGGNAGKKSHFAHGHQDYFMAEATYRF